MKKFHISHKFEEKNGGKENYLTKKFSPHSPLNIKNCPQQVSRWSLKVDNWDKFEGDKGCEKLMKDSFLAHTLDHQVEFWR